MAQSGANAQAQLNAAAAATTTQIPAEFFAMAMNRVQQQFSQVTAPAQQAQPRIRYPNQMLQQQLALLQSTVPATLNRSLPHQMTRTSRLVLLELMRRGEKKWAIFIYCECQGRKTLDLF
jgi:hypothetical protein